MDKEKKREYSKKYRMENKLKIKEQRRKYRENHREQLDKYRKEHNKRWKKKHGKTYHAEYMARYLKKPQELIKKRIRRMSEYYYGKVPKGFERHHFNYDNPHNFILVSIKKHKEIHKEICSYSKVCYH